MTYLLVLNSFFIRRLVWYKDARAKIELYDLGDYIETFLYFDVIL